ncbi:MAG: Eco47II family restriction endonuclease [Spirochaetota bacterium]
MALSWIADKVLLEIVSNILEIAQNAKTSAENDFNKNVIAPFSALFEISGFDIDYETWFKNETTWQVQKTLQNHVGDFHQKVLGSVKDWKDLGVGSVIDLLSEKFKIIAEVKNKYNTISGGKLADLYFSLDNLVMPKNSIYKGYTAYYVTIIPKKPARYNKLFTPSNKEKGEKCQLNESIRMIDGASFYSLVTGRPDALEELFNHLPSIIEKLSGKALLKKDKSKLDIFFKQAFQ